MSATREFGRFSLTAGVANATGALTRIVQFPYTPGLENNGLYAQCASLDMGQPNIPVSVSNPRYAASGSRSSRTPSSIHSGATLEST